MSSGIHDSCALIDKLLLIYGLKITNSNRVLHVINIIFRLLFIIISYQTFLYNFHLISVSKFSLYDLSNCFLLGYVIIAHHYLWYKLDKFVVFLRDVLKIIDQDMGRFRKATIYSLIVY